MDDVLQKIKEYLVLNNLKISKLSGLIFLCGGKIAKDRTAPAESVRDHVCRILAAENPELYNRVFLAERINDWLNAIISQTAHSSDLLSFEEHISGLASAICLVVESPGSIAELGAFSTNPAINPRLMVTMRSDFDTNDSFISLGPITYLKNLSPHRERVFVYPWKTKWDEALKRELPVQDDLNELGRELVEDLLKFEAENPKITAFDKSMKGHISLLLCDLIDWFSALKIGELHSLTESAGLPETESDLKWHLLILEKIGLIKTYTYRGTPYYVSLTDDKFIDYNFIDAPAILLDRSRIKIGLAREYIDKDKNRHRAIRHAKQNASGGDHAKPDQ